MKKEDKKEEKAIRKNTKAYLRYSAIGFQMVGIILLGIYGGYKADQFVELQFPLFTLLGSLLGIGAAMYYLIKETGKKG